MLLIPRPHLALLRGEAIVGAAPRMLLSQRPAPAFTPGERFFQFVIPESEGVEDRERMTEGIIRASTRRVRAIRLFPQFQKFPILLSHRGQSWSKHRSLVLPAWKVLFTQVPWRRVSPSISGLASGT